MGTRWSASSIAAALLIAGGCDAPLTVDVDVPRYTLVQAANVTGPEPAAEGAWAEGAMTPGGIVTLHTSLLPGPAESRSYEWTQVEGEPVDLDAELTPRAHFIVPASALLTTLSFSVTSTDDEGETESELLAVFIHGGGEPAEPPPPPPPTETEPPFVVFHGDLDLNDRGDLYRASVDGSEVIKLNAPFGLTERLLFYAISPDRCFVAYLTRDEATTERSLHVVHADGRDPQRVVGDLGPGVGVTTFAWAPDSQRLAFAADVDGVVELYTARTDGSERVRVSGPMTENGDLIDFSWSPSSDRLAYRADQFTDGAIEVFLAAADGSGNERISGPYAGPPFSLFFFTPAWSPDGRYVAHLSLEVLDETNIFAYDLVDGVARQVNEPVQPFTRFTFPAWSPDSSRLAYTAEFRSSGTFDLITSRADGTGSTFVALGNGIGGVGTFAWSPDGSQLAYQAALRADRGAELYTAGAEGEDNRRVSTDLGMDGSVGAFEWSPDGARLAYLGVTDLDPSPSSFIGQRELYVVRPDGSDGAKVSIPFSRDTSDVALYAWSPDSRVIAYAANDGEFFDRQLFSFELDSSRTARLTPVGRGDVRKLAFTPPDGSRIVYRSDQRLEDQYELFSAAPNGDGTNVLISGEIVENGDVFDFLVE